MTIGLFQAFAFMLVFYSLITVSCLAFFRRNVTSFYVASDCINAATTALLAVCAYFFVNIAGSYDDMVRISGEVNDAQLHGISSLYQTYSLNPLSAAIISIGVYTGDIRYLQMFSTFVTYALFFIILGILKRKLKADLASILFTSIIMLLNFNYVTAVTNIRFWIALNCVLLGIVVEESYRRRIIVTLLIIAGLLTHIGVAPVVIIYLLCKMLRGKAFVVLCSGILVYSVVLLTITKVFAGSSNPLIQLFTGRVAGYFGLTEDYANSYDAQQSVNQWIFLTLCLLFSIATCIIYLVRQQNNHSKLTVTGKNFIIGVLLFAIGSYTSYTVFARYSMLSIMLVIPMMLVLFQGYFTNGRTSQQMHSHTQSVSMHLLFIATLFLFGILLYVRPQTYADYAFVFTLL